MIELFSLITGVVLGLLLFINSTRRNKVMKLEDINNLINNAENSIVVLTNKPNDINESVLQNIEGISDEINIQIKNNKKNSEVENINYTSLNNSISSRYILIDESKVIRMNENFTKGVLFKNHYRRGAWIRNLS